MKKYIILLLLILLITLTGCRKELPYECNLEDNTFIPFFGDELFTLNNVNIGKLNVCNDELDTLESSQMKIQSLYQRVDEKNLSIDPDISGIEAYFDYYSNYRLYPENLVSYDAFDSYNGTMELAMIYEAFTQIKIFVDRYDDPLEGELNDFNTHEDFYKMRYYVTDNYLYFVQYHTPDGTQFTVTRIVFTDDNKMIFDHLTYFKEGKSFTYKYTYYQEGTYAVQASYRRYDDKKGMLDIKEADFKNQTLVEYYVSNYINPMYRYHEVNPVNQYIITYTQEVEDYIFSIELYDNNGFVYGETFDYYETPTASYRYNLKHIHNWDYYFQNELYIDEEAIDAKDSRVFVNTVINKGDFLIINQHIEYELYSVDGTLNTPAELNQTPLSNQQMSIRDNYNNEYVLNFFLDLLDNQEVKEVDLLDIWSTYVPKEFYEFIEGNK